MRNEAKVLQIFGKYVGTVKAPGLQWANPFYSKRSIMLRVRNFESAKLKVNDHDGNPIEIGAVVVARISEKLELDDDELQTTARAAARPATAWAAPTC